MAILEKQILWAADDATEDFEPHPLLWTKEQYHKMQRLGWFHGRRVELIEGEIIEMSPISSRHMATVGLVGKALRKVFGDACWIVEQAAFDSGPRSEPQPDVAVYEGDPRDYMDAVPSSSLLIAEVSKSSLRFDRTTKASRYADAGVQDYWIVNLRNNVLEIHRQPTTRPDQINGYESVTTLTKFELVAPLAASQSLIKVADLLP